MISPKIFRCLAVGLTIILVFSIGLSGCKPAVTTTETAAETAVTTTAAEETKAVSEKPFEGVTLNIGSFIFPSMDAVKKLLPEFEEKTGIKVVYDQIPYGDLREKLLLEASRKSGAYDVIFLDTIWVPEFVKGGYLFPVTDWVERDKQQIDLEDIPQNLWDYALRYEGQWYGLPAACHLGVYVYRKDLFDKYGLKAPESWDDQLEIAKKLTIDENNDGTPEIYGTGFRYRRGNQIVSDWFHFTGCFATYDSAWRSGLFYPDMKPAFNSPDMIAAAQFYTDFYLKYKVVPPEASNWEFGDIMKAFNEGRIATMVTENWACASLVDPAQSPMADKVGFYYPPGKKQTDGSIKYAFYAGGAFPWVISADSKNKEAAWEFIKWVSSKELHKKYIQMGGTEFRYSVMNDTEMQKERPWLQYMAKVSDECFYRPLMTEYPKYEEFAGAVLAQVITGELSVKEALDQAVAKMDEVLKEAGYYK
jgi:multiple sugar transport system substrate-binding protein